METRFPWGYSGELRKLSCYGLATYMIARGSLSDGRGHSPGYALMLARRAEMAALGACNPPNACWTRLSVAFTATAGGPSW